VHINLVLFLVSSTIFLVGCSTSNYERAARGPAAWVIKGEGLEVMVNPPRPLTYPLEGSQDRISRRIRDVYSQDNSENHFDLGAQQPRPEELGAEIYLAATCFGLDPLLFALILESFSKGYHVAAKPSYQVSPKTPYSTGEGIGAISGASIRMVRDQLYSESAPEEAAAALIEQASCYIDQSPKAQNGDSPISTIEGYRLWLFSSYSDRNSDYTRNYETSLLTSTIVFKTMLAVSNGNYISAWMRWVGWGPQMRVGFERRTLRSMLSRQSKQESDCRGSQTSFFGHPVCSFEEIARGVEYFFSSPEARSRFSATDHPLFSQTYINQMLGR